MRYLLLSVLVVCMVGILMIPNAFAAYYDPVDNQIKAGYRSFDGSIDENEDTVCGNTDWLLGSWKTNPVFCYPHLSGGEIAQSYYLGHVYDCKTFAEVELTGSFGKGTATVPYEGEWFCLKETKNSITAFIRYPLKGSQDKMAVELWTSPNKANHTLYHMIISKDGEEIYNQLEQDKRTTRAYNGMGGMVIPFAGEGTYDFTVAVDSDVLRQVHSDAWNDPTGIPPTTCNNSKPLRFDSYPCDATFTMKIDFEQGDMVLMDNDPCIGWFLTTDEDCINYVEAPVIVEAPVDASRPDTFTGMMFVLIVVGILVPIIIIPLIRYRKSRPLGEPLAATGYRVFGQAGVAGEPVNMTQSTSKKIERKPSQKPAKKKETSAFCENCGKPLKPTAKFCGKCGTPRA